jgi:hydroxymethylglutaryl-CoA synthase
MHIGIEKMNLYAGSLVLDIEDLARARKMDPEQIKERAMVHKKAQNVDYEDVITLAVNAANPIITERDKDEIELCIFATESGLDYCKSNSTYVCKYLGLKPNVRNFEIKNACYATTCALQMAASWIGSQVSPGKKALVVSSDVNYSLKERPNEEIPAVGAVAMLVSDSPRVVELEMGKTGHYSFECTDYMRPTRTVDILKGEESVYAYLDCVEGAWDHYRLKAVGADSPGYFKRLIYHCPSGGLVKIAHGMLVKEAVPDMSRKQVQQDFEERVSKSFLMTNEIGHTYSSSVYMCLISLLLKDNDIKTGDRIGVFSYGSGCCSEFFSVVILPEAREYVKTLGLEAYFRSRYRISVAQYDTLTEKRMAHACEPTYETEIDYPEGWYEKNYHGKKLLIFKGTEDYVRKYEWS